LINSGLFTKGSESRRPELPRLDEAPERFVA
jgi:hypothetical protein